ncbi:MAG: zinc-binding dehydrogenase, partial [Calditrichia bacterium]
WMGKKVIINPSLDWGNDLRVQQKNYRILGLPDHGTHAELVKVPAGNLTRKPSYLSFEEAAALPLAGLTGYRALFVKGRVMPGETVFITGIGGGVAALMLQMAVAAGARVFVSSGSPSKLEKAKQAGAAGGINYTEKNWARNLAKISGGAGIDLIVDGAGGKEFNQLISLVKPAGRIVVYGATAGNPEQIDLRKIFWKQISICGTTMGNQQDFDRMVKFYRKHKIKPIISHIYPLAGYKKAYQEMMEGKQLGKIVLVP